MLTFTVDSPFSLNRTGTRFQCPINYEMEVTLLMARKNSKTTMQVISVFDGKQAAQDVFIGLIADRYRAAKTQESLADQFKADYTEDEVPELRNLSGLAG